MVDRRAKSYVGEPVKSMKAREGRVLKRIVGAKIASAIDRILTAIPDASLEKSKR